MYERKLLDQVRSEVNLIEVVQRHVGLKPHGQNWKGCCPFHQEKTPSFFVVPGKKIYHCFGCGAGGDVFQFLQAIKGVSFPEAVTSAAELVGIEVENSGYSRRKDLLGVASVCQQWFTSQLDAAAPYLRRRGYTKEVAQAWMLGYAPDTWDALTNHLLRNYVPLEDAVAIGVLVEKNGRIYDRFRGRLIIPIHDDQGRPIAFAGRDLTNSPKTPKYVNSPECPIYQKGKTLYGLDQALKAIRETRRVVVVEGYTDVHAFHMAGMQNVVATCGTALTEAQAKRLTRLSKTVLLAGDPDLPGQKAMVKHLPSLASVGAEVLRIPLPLDPADTWREHGPDGLKTFVEQAHLFLPEAIRIISDSHDHTPQGRERASGDLKGILSAFRGVARDGAIRTASSILGVSEGRLRALSGRPESPFDGAGDTPVRLDPATASICWVVMHHPEMREEMVSMSSPEWFPQHVRSFLEELIIGDDVASALSLSDEAIQPSLRGLAVDAERFGQGQAKQILYEGIVRTELNFINGTMGQAHNGVRFELQKRRLYLREYLAERSSALTVNIESSADQ